MKTKTSNLAPDGSGILFLASLARKRYSGQRDRWCFENEFPAPGKSYKL
jgi:hypothetical protein